MPERIELHHRICFNCTWMKKHESYAECRFRAPVASPEDSVAWWPVVKDRDWCAEFRRRSESVQCDEGRGE